ncbi:MAG: hypothetical protein HUK20_09780 [Fibrobacter sp.]|nr:hypothetical protein [Fibrobacter sp.]
MARVAIVLLLLCAALFAKTQEAAYFRAMQAEEAGDIPLAIKTFEEAYALGGPYTEEIGGILDEYYDALGISPGKRLTAKRGASGQVDLQENPWSFHFSGELEGTAMSYAANGKKKEWGALLQGAASAFIDYTAGSLTHSLGMNLTGDLNVNNDDMPVLDTNDRKASVGIEYNLIGTDLLLDVGVDLNAYEEEGLNLAYYTWLEYSLYKKNDHKVGIALWLYYDAAGPASISLYGIWRKTAKDGFSYSIMVGPRMEMDSTFDYVKYLDDYGNALDEAEMELESSYAQGGYDAFNYCMENYAEQCFSMSLDQMDSLFWDAQIRQIYSRLDVGVDRYWTKWIGPSLRAKVLYRFKNALSLEFRTNLSYSWVLDGPDKKYEDISKLSAVCSGTFKWTLGPASLYLTLEDSYKFYKLPAFYEDFYPKHSDILKLKLGTRFEL